MSIQLVASGTESELKLKLQTLRGLIKAIESAPPWQKIDAATNALAVADELLAGVVQRVDKLYDHEVPRLRDLVLKLVERVERLEVANGR